VLALVAQLRRARRARRARLVGYYFKSDAGRGRVSIPGSGSRREPPSTTFRQWLTSSSRIQ
jgi:hypothetical protein